jgi:hypothetical protein
MNKEKLMNKMLLSCKEATLLIEKKQVYPLAFKENIRLYIHTKMCFVCNIYQYQSRVMENAILKWIQEADKQKTMLSQKVKDNIIFRLRQA